jgi:membrane-associated phospholipid phosphatase
MRGAAVLAASLLLVLIIAVLKSRGVLAGVDRAVMAAMGAQRDGAIGQAVTSAMILASLIGETAGRIVMVLLACAWLCWKERKRAAGWLIVITVGGTLLNLALKQVFATPRPDLLPHLDIVNSYSFPSGHAAGNMIFFGAVAMLVQSWATRAVAIIMILLIGVSRVWLGVHWPSDVAAGWIEGIGWLALCAIWLPRGQGNTIPRDRQ